jgi:hypothetical protein
MQQINKSQEALIDQKSKDVANNRNQLRIRRSPWYIFGLVLTLVSTTLILTSIFTDNWRQTIKDFQTETYFTSGLWRKCRVVSIDWYQNRKEVFCQTNLSNSEAWLVACQIFFPIAAFLKVFALLSSYYGLCNEIRNFKKAIPSFIMWLTLGSTILELITISIYGALGLKDYSNYEPDYSIIIASVGLFLDASCIIMFIVEIVRD